MADLRLGIVQDYVPQFRVAFFEGLIDRLSGAGIECVVIAGEPTGSQAARSDAAQPLNSLRQASAHEVRIGPNGPRVYGFGSSRNWRDCDGVIHALRGTAIDLHMEILAKRFSGRRVGVWGHIGRKVNSPNALDVMLERWQMRHSDHVFGYTRECADAALAAGMPAGKITAVMNSIEVDTLLDAYRALDREKVETFINRHSLTPGKIFGFIGGLDSSKRIDFLAEVLEYLWRSDRDVKIIVGGKGDNQGLLEPARERGQVIMLGFSGPVEKAMIMKTSQALVNPGRIGLVAVDALAVGIPILATDWNFHAPEYDYLERGHDVLESRNVVSDFGKLVLQATASGESIPLHEGRPYPSLDQMVENFALGVQKMFA
ncbi:glycosyltransferase [Mycolicibacterium sp.]|uniref:glycosyltransferase n=1 Tax=Mycolicibacterium sp. TaxID=2320850 RepID=UPI0037C6CDD7